jgi:predicted O-linked N-acetylglucosamine transferase (SPINDLY family)
MSITERLVLAQQYYHAGDFNNAEHLFQQILEINPNHIESLHSLGIVALQTGRLELAANCIRRVVELKPDWAEAHNNLGAAYHYEKKVDDAIACYYRAVQLKPSYADAYANLGKALTDQGKPAEAIQWFSQALQVKPDHAASYNNWAVALQELGRLDEAVECCRWAVQLKPDYADAHYNLGTALKEQGKLEEAIACYHRALRLNPNLPEAHNNLGNALFDQGRMDEAEACFRRTVELNPRLAEPQNNLGNILKDRGQLDEAVVYYQKALALNPLYPEAHNNLGNAFKDAGELDQAIGCYRRCLELKPGFARAHSNLICTLQYHPGLGVSAIEEELRRYSQQYALPLEKLIQPHVNEPSPDRRLRLGYVSADFRDHVVGRNIRPLMRNHDHKQFEIFLYTNRAGTDFMTKQFRGWSDHWSSITGWTDEQAAEQIRKDGIDVLVDLSVHTAGNRLLVFARKPAPVQVSFAGYPGSPGLTAIDYRLTDPFLDPPGANDHYAERRFRLPHSFWCYDPDGDEPGIAALPAANAGKITFGCLNNFCKINNAVLELWARVLSEVEGSRLFLLAKEGSHQQRTIAFLAERGIDSKRIDFSALKPRTDYLALYDQVDIGLDTFPYNGHTTSLDSYWMGVPVITLIGDLPAGRAGLSQLTNLGLEEMAASTPEEFVHIASQLANDLHRLESIRRGLRSRMQQSPLMDAAGFARDIEAAYRTMWQQWCDSRQK